MSPSDASFSAMAEAVSGAGDQILAANATAEVPDASVQQLLTTAARLYARKVDEEDRSFSPLADGQSLTATDVAVTVTALMQAADLNLFDVAMWAGRKQPGGGDSNE